MDPDQTPHSACIFIHLKVHHQAPRLWNFFVFNSSKNGKRKVQGVPHLQTAALPRHQEEEETDKSKQAQIDQTYEKHKDLFPKRGNRNAKRTEKHKNKMAQGKTYNKSPRRINHKAPKSLKFSLLINIKMPTTGILIFISREKFMLSYV